MSFQEGGGVNKYKPHKLNFCYEIHFKDPKVLPEALFQNLYIVCTICLKHNCISVSVKLIVP